jgi:hypothetical protein
MNRIAHLIAIALLLTGCIERDAGDSAISVAPEPSEAAATAWISGIVLAGPVCPVESVSPDPSCADRPVPGAILVVEDAAGGEVARVAATPDGTFRVELPEGSYRLVPQPVEGVMGTATPIDLLVVAGEPISDLVVAYDTGIR